MSLNYAVQMRTHPRRHQSGMSLVELLVGVTVGLFVVAAASTLLAMQLTDNRRLMLETQIQQDLRASADIIGRELRRAGAWGTAVESVQSVWRADQGSVQTVNALVSPTAAPSDTVTFQSSRTTGQPNYGFRLLTGGIETQLNTSTGLVWQELTDRSTMLVRRFVVTPINEPGGQLVCQKLCVVGSTLTKSCWPTTMVRSFRIEIDAEAVSDSSVKRSVDTRVRLRNDRVRFDPALPQSCPT